MDAGQNYMYIENGIKFMNQNKNYQQRGLRGYIWYFFSRTRSKIKL